MSMREVAEIFDPVITPQAVAAWERKDGGKKPPSIPEEERLEILATAYQVNYNWLTTGSGSHDTPDEKFLKFGINGFQSFVPLLSLSDISVGNIKAAMAKALLNQAVKPSFWDDDKERFSFEVKGTSMAPTYNEGDIVYCLRQDFAEPGEYVVIDIVSMRQTMFRRFRYNEQGQIVLDPENKNWRPLIYNEEQLGVDIHILGVKCGRFARD